MRLLSRLAIGAGVLLLLGLGLLLLGLPRLVASDAVRARIEQEGRTATGREVRYEKLTFGWLPPRLRMEKVRVAGPRDAAPPFLEAESVDLVLALLPLLTRTLLVDSLAVEGAALHLTRTEDGFDLPRPEKEPPAGSDPSRDSDSQDESSEGSGLSLAVREARLRAVRVTLLDHTVSPSVRWEIENLEGRFEASARDQPVRFEARGGLASGGSFEADGTLELAGGVAGELRLDSFALAPLAPYAGEGRPLAGQLSGTLRGERRSSQDAHLVADLVLTDADLVIEEMAVAGRVEIAAELRGDLGAPSGTFELDATAAKLDYSRAFQKPPGTTATLTGRLVPGKDGGLDVEDLRLEILDLDVKGRLGLREGRGDSKLRLAAFDLDFVGDQLDTRALLEALGDSSARLEGPLDLVGDLRLPLGAADALEAMTGTIRLEIRPGRLRGISLLEKTFEGLGAAGSAALLAGNLKGGKTLQRFYGDEFESLSGTLRLAQGTARTDDLSLVYRHYTVDLRGSVGLREGGLDLTGTLTIDDEIDASLVGEGREDPAASRPGHRQVIRLARVRGTVNSPRIELTEETVLTFASLYATSRRREKWERKIDERLGDGSGEAVLEALDSLLSGEPRDR